MHRLFTISSFLLIGWVIAQGLRIAADRLDPPRHWWANERKNVRAARRSEVWDGVEILAVGNSHAGAFDFPSMGRRGKTMNRAGGDIHEMRAIGEYWLGQAEDVELLFVAVSYYVLHADNGLDGIPVENRSNRIAFYANQPIWWPVAGDRRLLALGKLQRVFPHQQVVRWDAWEAPSRAVIARLRDFAGETEQSSTEGQNTGASSMSIEEISRMRSARDAEIIRRRGIAQVPDLVAELAAIGAFTSHRSIRLVLITPPYHRTYNLFFDQELPGEAARHRQRLSKLARTVGAEFYDFSNDPRWSTRDEWFTDSDHLSDRGRASFSRELARVLFAEMDMPVTTFSSMPR